VCCRALQEGEDFGHGATHCDEYSKISRTE